MFIIIQTIESMVDEPYLLMSKSKYVSARSTKVDMDRNSTGRGHSNIMADKTIKNPCQMLKLTIGGKNSLVQANILLSPAALLKPDSIGGK